MRSARSKRGWGCPALAPCLIARAAGSGCLVLTPPALPSPLLARRSSDDEDAPGSRSSYRLGLSFFGTLHTHVEAWVTDATVELLRLEPGVAQQPSAPDSSPEVVAALARFLAIALPPVAVALALAPPRGEVERALDELLRTMRVLGPLPAFKVSQLLAACPPPPSRSVQRSQARPSLTPPPPTPPPRRPPSGK